MVCHFARHDEGMICGCLSDWGRKSGRRSRRTGMHLAQGKSLTEAAMSWRSCHLAQHRWFGSDHNKFWCLPSWTQDRARKALSRGKYVWSFVGPPARQMMWPGHWMKRGRPHISTFYCCRRWTRPSNPTKIRKSCDNGAASNEACRAQSLTRSADVLLRRPG